MGIALSMMLCLGLVVPSVAWADAATDDGSGSQTAGTYVEMTVNEDASQAASDTSAQELTLMASGSSKVAERENISSGYITIYDWYSSSGVEYKGEPVTFSDYSVRTKYGYSLTEGTDYVISYINNDRIGTATMVATGIGDYCGEIKENFEITMFEDGRAKAISVKYSSATLSWTKIPGAAGYNIYKRFMRGKEKLYRTITSGATTSLKLTGLCSNADYEFYIVPFAIIDGKRVEYDDAYMASWFDTPICYNSKFFTSNKKLQKSIGKVLGTYKNCHKFKGSGQCYGYAEWASKKIAKKRKYVKINKSLTPSNVRKYICTLKPGAHVRITGHSLVIIKASKDVIYWADNNYSCRRGTNRVHYWTGSPEMFDRIYNSHSKIVGVYKTVSYR